MESVAKLPFVRTEQAPLPPGAYHPERKTLTVVDPYGKARVMNFGLRPGTFEHLTLDNLTLKRFFFTAGCKLASKR